MRMGRRSLSLMLFVDGYLALATLAPTVAAAPALATFVAATMLLAREPQPTRI
jgi:hypothetical protein